MARKRTSRARERRLAKPEDVLAGRVEVRPEALFDLIHLVNPTSRDLSAQEKIRRYEQKVRLQSLLVRRFGDEHVAVKATGDDAVVGLVHRSGSRNACHAVVSELDPDARSWVRRQLDDAASSVAPSAGHELRPAKRARGDSSGPEDGAPPAVEELLRRARKAVEDYDYESAERHLKLAFDTSPGREDVALALLELWVGVLGVDQQALEIEPRLSAAAKATGEIRTYLALAAARAGETEQALRLARGTSLHRTAEVYAVLASQAIRERDREAASRHLSLVSRYDPTHREIPRLTEEVRKLRTEDLRGTEQELRRRYETEGCFAVEGEARDLAARWPASELARRILREVAGERRAAEIAAHLAEAEEALSEERFDDAARHFQAALDAGCDRADLPALLEEAQARGQQRHEQSQVDDVADRLATGPAGLKGALLGYLALPETLRTRVRQRVGHPALTWADQLQAPRSAAKSRVAVAALLTLGQAIENLRQGDARAALDLLEPLPDALENVEDARRCLREARSRRDRELRDRAFQALEAAWEAWGDSRTDLAKESLEAIDFEDLGDEDRCRAEDLRARIEHAETVARLEQEYERHLAARDFLGALDRVRRLVEMAPEQRRWVERGERLRRRIRTAWRIEVSKEPTPLEQVHDFWHHASMSEPCVWLDDEGRRLVLADACGPWLFVRLVDVESRTICERASLRLPEDLGSSLVVCWEGDRLRLAGARGLVLELELTNWDVLGWHSVRELLPQDVVSEAVTLLPGSAYLWLEADKLASGEKRRLALEPQTYVIDLKAGRVSRRLPRSWCDILPILGPQEPRVLIDSSEADDRALTSESTVRIYTVRGTEAASLRLKGTTRAVSISPDENGLLLLLALPVRRSGPRPGDHESDHAEAAGPGWDWMADDDEEDMFLIHFEESSASGTFRTGTGLKFPDASSLRIHAIATSLDQGLSFLLVTTWDLDRDLLALGVSRKGLEMLYRSGVPYGTLLVQDRHARHVAAVLTDGRYPEVLRLGPDEPEPVPSSHPLAGSDTDVPTTLDASFFCHVPTGPVGDRVLARVTELHGMSRLARQRFLRQLDGEDAFDPDARAELCLALRRTVGVHDEEHERLIRALAKDDPNHAGASLLMADLEARDRRWEDVLRRLRAISPAAFDDDGRACHYYHLLGLALLHANHPQEALEAFGKSLHYEEGQCGLETLIYVAKAVTDPLEAGEWGLDQPVARQLIGAIRKADRALAAGDGAAARQALERPALWRTGELQGAARLAASYLELETATSNEHFLKRHALAFFCHVYGSDERRRDVFVPPGMSWGESRLSDLEKRARTWLDETRRT